jgi:purine-cytosine permease-like protein
MNIKKWKNLIIIGAVIFVLMVVFGIYQIRMLDKAHSTFENYYAFRGCTKLISRTDDAGFCQVANGETIKIVKFQGKWFLDGDLPCGFLCF